MTELDNFCHSLPKIELHIHLAGSIRFETLYESFQKQNLPNALDMAKSCVIWNKIDECQQSEQMGRFTRIGSSWSSREDTKRWARELIEDLKKQNVVYCELRTSGSNRDKLVDILDVFEEHAKVNDWPIMRLIVSINRSWSLEQADNALKCALELLEKGIVALDFCDDPTKGNFGKYAYIFAEAAKNGLPFTCHFAESQNEPDLLEILDSSPFRLGHASYMSEEAMKKVYEKKNTYRMLSFFKY